MPESIFRLHVVEMGQRQTSQLGCVLEKFPQGKGITLEGLIGTAESFLPMYQALLAYIQMKILYGG